VAEQGADENDDTPMQKEISEVVSEGIQPPNGAIAQIAEDDQRPPAVRNGGVGERLKPQQLLNISRLVEKRIFLDRSVVVVDEPMRQAGREGYGNENQQEHPMARPHHDLSAW
jgi:hypothetical protein